MRSSTESGWREPVPPVWPQRPWGSAVILFGNGPMRGWRKRESAEEPGRDRMVSGPAESPFSSEYRWQNPCPEEGPSGYSAQNSGQTCRCRRSKNACGRKVSFGRRSGRSRSSFGACCGRDGFRKLSRPGFYDSMPQSVNPLDRRQDSTSKGPSAWNTIIGLPEARLKERYR